MHQICRVMLLISIGLYLLVPTDSPAADLHFSSDTIVRGFDRDSEKHKKLKAVPVYEYLQMDYGNLDKPGVSVHANGWGRLNLADNYNEKDTAGEILHAYLQYTSPARDLLVRAGRQFLFEGVARDSFDGIYAKSHALQSLVLSAYAGSPVTLASSEGRKNDLIAGGGVAYALPKYFEIGASYKYIADNGKRDEENIGTDFTVMLPGSVYLMGHSAFNLISSGWKEHSFELRLPYRQFAFQPFFQHYRYSDFNNSRQNSANPFRFLRGIDNTLTVAGTEFYWYQSERQEYVLRFKNYDYDKRFSSSQLYSMLAVWKWKIQSEVGAEFGRMQGNNAENSYYLGRGYFFWNASPGFLTGDLMYVSYDQAIYKKDSSLFASFGGGRKFVDDSFSAKITFDYSRDPYFDSDYRWMLKLSYLLDKSDIGRTR